MTYDEYLDIIANSDKSDWKYDEERKSYLYLPNISIMMVAKNDFPEREFYEDWITNFPNEKASVHITELHYNGARIDDYYTAMVDDNSMCIPYPDSETRSKITRQQYNIARIINIPYSPDHCDRYDNYIRTAGFEVVD